MAEQRHVFVVGLDDFHLAQLREMPGAQACVFHPLFTRADLKEQAQFPVERLLEEGPRRLRAAGVPVDAVVGYWDFPVSTVLPLLRRPFGLPGPSLEAVLRCEHKYWSRRCQAEVVPEQVPAFCAVDPFAPDAAKRLELDFPFWIKPVKAVLSHLGFRIDDAAGLEAALERIRRGIDRYAVPFNRVLQEAGLPPEIAAVDGRHCIAEALISSGAQCTQEGWAHAGEVNVYGTVDSLRCGPLSSSFDRYQYPSALPVEVLERMSAVSRRVMTHLGYDDGPFNIEYFWDEATDRIWLLEINPRVSKSHAPLFRLVDGVPNFKVMLDLALGRRPGFEPGGGACALAAKFMLRQFRDARVVRVPTDDDIAAVEAAVPHCKVQVEVREGMRLSELRDQDSYSYEVATLFIGADTPAQLEQRHRACLAALPLRFEDRGAVKEEG